DSLTFVTERYDSTMGETVFNRSVLPPYQSIVDTEEWAVGSFAQISWRRTLSEKSEMTLQTYYDHRHRHAFLYDSFSVDTVDLDFQHAFKVGKRNDIVWGLGYRHNSDEMENGFSISLNPTERTQHWVGAFVQDEIALIPDSLYLTVGSKFEHNSFSAQSVEFQPNVRLRWNTGETGTAWASISRAIRLPSRGDLDGRVVSAVLPPVGPPNTAPIPLVIGAQGNPDLLSEELIAYEVGYRIQPTDDLALDVALFLHDHDKERSLGQGIPVCVPSGVPIYVDPLCVLAAQYIDSPFPLDNRGTNESYGIEAFADWTPTSWWRLQTAYSSLRFRDRAAPATPTSDALTQDSPEHQLSIRSLMNFGSNTEFDLWLRFTDELENIGVDSYLTLDARLAWSPTPRLRLSVVGRNLFDDAHQEFVSEIRDVVPVQLERRAYLEASWNF
ncbi:MAG: TonB-dependent receptor plug domain-containing protein, partial [Woeseiaceae bacterium]